MATKTLRMMHDKVVDTLDVYRHLVNPAISFLVEVQLNVSGPRMTAVVIITGKRDGHPDRSERAEHVIHEKAWQGQREKLPPHLVTCAGQLATMIMSDRRTRFH